jgi:hypothetical protein
MLLGDQPRDDNRQQAMFDIQTESPDQLKRIVIAGSGGILLGLTMIALNFVVPLVSGSGYETTNIVFGLFGVVAVVMATHPTYQAAELLDNS